MGTSWCIDIDGKKYKPQEISARILQKLKNDAEAYLGDTVSQAVITVPAYFDDAQRTPPRRRASRGPRGAAHHQRADRRRPRLRPGQEEANGHIARLRPRRRDLRRPVLDIGDGVFEVSRTAGDTHLGGDDWDQRVIDWLVRGLQEHRGVDLSARQDGPAAPEGSRPRRRRSSCRRCRRPTINLPFITADSEGPKHLDMKLTRAKFDELTEDLFEACRGPSSRPSRTPGLQVRHRRRRPRRWLDAHARIQQISSRTSSARSRTRGSTPTRWSPSARPSRPGVLKGEVKDVLLLDVTPLSPRHRDQGWSHAPPHRAEHDHPDKALRGLHDRRGQPTLGRDPRLQGVGSSDGIFGTLNFLPREAKNSAMLSMEL